MASVKVNKPDVVVPPPTYTVELDQAEMATLLVILAKTIPYDVQKSAERLVDDDAGYDERVINAAMILAEGGYKNMAHPLYDNFVAGFDA